MEDEIFKEIPGLPGYLASNLGNIMSRKRQDTRILSKGKSRLGFETVILFNEGKMLMGYVSRLVLTAFRGYPADPWLCFAHNIDGDLTNNRLDNLEWVVCETTEDYDPQISHRRGVLKPECTKERMTEAKLHQSEETKRKSVESRRRTWNTRNQ